MSRFATRFAPSPTGRLHKGHAFSALTAFSAAQDAGGRFLLRIEDIDPTRCKPEFEDGIYEDLRWLGLDWEEPVRRQSDHLDDYAAAVETLRQRGLVYRCFRTRKEILDGIGHAPHGITDAARPGPHSANEEAELLQSGKPFAWRLSLERARDTIGGAAWDNLSFFEEGHGPDGETGHIRARPELAGDVVLARKDAGAAYHLAAPHDDALQGITHIIRGQDLFEATHIQRLIQTLFGWDEPVYRHHRLMTDTNGKRFAKRDGSVTLAALRENGVSADALRAEVLSQMTL
ncbi:tRNA glutamyl-Q(34) synthetase GluQRS [Brevundimonas sp.]|uniref:tRNA glutamyl-Q(34) synthetase GluQRS n=1 Tax=Brevundimonas sp. TaxID=1871086 RepID=UPI00289F3EA3|nr:tRNA glutamyl-Q(34) synthetase GluQRS [Brevundimonas sp.]